MDSLVPVCPDCGGEMEPTDCDDCGGSGIADADSRELCELCGGDGIGWYCPDCAARAQAEETLHNAATAAQGATSGQAVRAREGAGGRGIVVSRQRLYLIHTELGHIRLQAGESGEDAARRFVLLQPSAVVCGTAPAPKLTPCDVRGAKAPAKEGDRG